MKKVEAIGLVTSMKDFEVVELDELEGVIGGATTATNGNCGCTTTQTVVIGYDNGNCGCRVVKELPGTGVTDEHV